MAPGFHRNKTNFGRQSGAGDTLDHRKPPANDWDITMDEWAWIAVLAALAGLLAGAVAILVLELAR